MTKRECPICHGEGGSYEACGEDYAMVWLTCSECEGTGEVDDNGKLKRKNEMITKDQELVSFTLAIEEISAEDNAGVGVKGLKFMLRQAARQIRNLRPDLAFTEQALVRAGGGDGTFDENDEH